MMRPRAALLPTLGLVVALGASACARSAPVSAPPVAVPTPPPVAVRTAPVARGDIQQVLNYTGDIKARSQIQVMPQIAGRVERINVDVGSRVNAGDVIAELDRDSVQAQLDQNQAALAAAEAKLASMLAGPKPEDVAAAEAAVANAQSAAAAAQVRLEQASSPARSEAIAAAQAQLNQLKARLAQVQRGAKPEDVEALQAQVDQASAQVEQAASSRDSATANVAALQAQVRSAEQQVVAAQAQLDDARYRQQQAAEGKGGPGIRQEDIDAAQAQVDQAWLNWQKLLNSPTPEDLAIAEAAVKVAEKQVKVAQESYDAAKDCDGPACPDEDTAKAQVDVAKAQLEQARANLAKVQAGPTEYDIKAAEAAFHAAEATRDKLKTGGSSDAEALQLNVTVRQAALEQARGQLAQLQGALQQALSQQQSAEAGLAAAEAVRAAAQARLDSARNADTFDVAAAQEAVNQAQAQLNQLINPDQYNVRLAQAQLAQANAQLEQARAQLASVQHPFKEEDIQAQQALVEQARAAVAAARVNLDEATIRAPVAGVVSERLVSEGALVGQTTPIVSLVPPGLELEVAVEEANLAAVAPGQPVSVSVAAYPGQQFQGTVATVSPTVDPKSRTVQVKINLEDPASLLRPGMFAQLGIVTQTRQATLLVPRAAVVDRGTEPAVFVVREGKAIRVPVKLGIFDNEHFEVVEGLQEGDLVVVSGQSDLTSGDTVVASAS